MPLANSFLRSLEEFGGEQFYPLDVYFCERCTLVQLLDVIDPEVLFRNYLYVTGTSDTMAAHNQEYARTLVELLNLGTHELVVEVASNDGSLLKCFKPYGVTTVGIEPAVNVAEIACASGVETVSDFFNSDTARRIRESHGPAKVVLGNNVLAHVDETQDFLNGCKDLLDDDGLVVVEVPYLRDLIENLEYDTIYHEHLCYFSVTSLARLYDAVGLSVVRIDHVPVHGGSLRIYARLRKNGDNHAQGVLRLVEQERQAGLHAFARYALLAKDIENNRRSILGLLGNLARDGKTVAGYGAPAKGNTLLNYCGIDNNVLPFTVDKNPLKVGLYTPGTHIPVLPVSTLQERRPDYLLILAWNFADEIIQQQQMYSDKGGRFVIPIPKPKVIL